MKPVLIHGSNLITKENHKKKYKDAISKQYLAEIRAKYDNWHSLNMQLIGPRLTVTENDFSLIEQRVLLFEEYKNFLDQQQYAEKFDSRSNLHSSALEEFLYYLFKDLVNDFGSHALIGKSSAFKDLFFVPPKYSKMLSKPYGRVEKKNHDFVIGITVQASLQTTKPGLSTVQEKNSDFVEQIEIFMDENEQDENEEKPIIVDSDELSNLSEKLESSNAEVHFFDIPVVAIECKTYLDKTMLEGSSRAAEELKARNPNGLYIVVMEWIKLSEDVNLRKYKVDQIYVLRKQKNTDREYRFADNYIKNSIDSYVVWHLFHKIREHLTADWQGGVEHGLQRGWLLDD